MATINDIPADTAVQLKSDASKQFLDTLDQLDRPAKLLTHFASLLNT